MPLIILTLAVRALLAQEVSAKPPEKDPRDVKIEQLTKLLQAYQNRYFTCEDRLIVLEALPPKP